MSNDKLDWFKEVAVFNRSGVHRCSICNCVNQEDIQTNIGDYRGNMFFTKDPKNPNHFICGECEEAIQDVRWDYEIMDDEEEDDDSDEKE